ncbi:hypothetical protein [Acinetobacter nematophilus]|uniref:Uncharacterized protein n=1 Tax=Acinetobacter nematophilus TaxID=2994642 RepID=A0A9X3DWJ5_9GAMM|nr:hypothetical protein [Acinetobacter nematophilus]MCX5468566.1 hypothetical protein [Acinetobacter nematophilus]
MNLMTLCNQLKVSAASKGRLPDYLLGAFRRKSISFANGLTDETTLVYWFQSKSFTIDLRLKSQNSTPVLERQGWVGNTLWNEQQQLLSWQITSNYQNHVQWPEPAKLYAIGNAILEFSPSRAYVEDWRQQAKHGLFLGLRLFKIENMDLNISYPADGGLIICDHFIAFARSRHPDIQQRLEMDKSLSEAFAQEHISVQDIQDYEVSVSFGQQMIDLSTVTAQVGKSIELDHFSQLDHNTLIQQRFIQGQRCQLYFTIDVFDQDFCFSTQTATSNASLAWFEQEHNHLFHHAEISV